MLLEELPEEILDLIAQYTGIYNYNLRETSPTFNRISSKYNTPREKYINALIKEGNLDLIQKHNFIFTTKHVKKTIKYGQLPILIWAFEKGLKLTVDLTYTAAEYDQLEILIWLRRNGCPCNATTWCVAMNADTLRIFFYAVDNGWFARKIIPPIQRKAS